MFSTCLFETVQYRNKEFHNSAINLSLVTHISKESHHEYPETSDAPAPAIKFHLVNDKNKIWIFHNEVERNECFAKLCKK